ncbi:MAG: DMT family transporter [Psychroflexus sp.]|nr:DMT family transporter [Psychroflexus sp.]MDR9448287.1 DMT family transporter [Psychroflexus sp.]
MKNRIPALLAATVATSIYGINHTLAKGLMPDYILPFGFIMLRVGGAAAIFWLIGLFQKDRMIERQDWSRLLGAAFFGMVINMLLFFKGLSLTTPINSSVIVTLSPLLVFVLSALLIREKITPLKIIGVLIGLSGAVALIIFGQQTTYNAPNIPLGNTLIIINALSFGMYLIVVRPLTSKYKTITLMKWLFLMAFVINLPVTFGEFTEVEWANLPFSAIWRMGYVVIGTTCLTYLLNTYALRHLSASTIGIFVYLQPVIAIAYAIISGVDDLTLTKIMAGIAVFVGVFLVTKNPARKRPKLN